MSDALVNERDVCLSNGDIDGARRASWQLIAVSDQRDSAIFVAQGVAFMRFDKIVDAAAFFFSARDKFPLDHQVRLYCAMAYSYFGDYARANTELMWSLKIESRKNPYFWNGESAAERVYVLAPGGIGDIIFNLRYLSSLRRFFNRVAIVTPERLIGLLQSNRVCDEYVGLENSNKLVFQTGDRVLRQDFLSLLSSPQSMRSQSNFRLRADPTSVQYWNRQFETAHTNQFRIGLCWQSKQHSQHHLYRSFALKDLSPVSCIPDSVLVSLQNGHGSEQLDASDFRVRFCSFQDEVSLKRDFENTAAVIENCDVIVSCDTGIAHLSASLGKPTFVICKEIPSAYWHGSNYRNTYPTASVFRQPSRGDWGSAIRAAVSRIELFRAAEADKANPD
jgi:ADP-heptose:LPS heptosyltransferase